MVAKKKTAKKSPAKSVSKKSKLNATSFKENVYSSDAFSFERKGDQLIGYYDGCTENVGENDSKMHRMKTTVGGKDTSISFWGCTVLDGKLEKVREGAPVMIIFQGKGTGKKGKNAPKLFDVKVQNSRDLIG